MNVSMSSRPLALAFLLVLLSSAWGCLVLGERIRGSGKLTTEERSVGDFHEVVVTNQGDLEIQTGEENRLVIEAETNLIPHLVSEVRNGKLVLGTTRGSNLRPTRGIRYFLTTKALDGIHTSSSGDIRADRLEGDRLTVGSSSSGDITVGELRSRDLEVRISSSGDITIGGGEVEHLELSISSSGDFSANELRSGSAEVRLSSSGDASIRVDSHLKARLSSSGNLYYQGDPEVDSKVSSSGRVRHRR